MIRFGIKVGLAVGAVYYLSEQGVWKESTEAGKLYGKIGTALEPYTKTVSEQIPFKIPDLPNSNQISYLTKQYWNKGVMATFNYLSDLPEHVNDWVEKGTTMAQENAELKKLLGSFSGKEKTEK